MNKEELIQFEKEVVELFNSGQLKSPVHLSGGNEPQLIEIFEDINKEDWVFSNYRSHYHSLLKGVDRDWLINWIKDNKSIHVMNKEHKIFTSAIVGGTLSIALGTALSIKLKKDTNHVWVFVGDMTGHTGIFWETVNYAQNHELPITFVIEDNGLSTDTPTNLVWGENNEHYYDFMTDRFKNIVYYNYNRVYPHYGTGVFVSKLWEDTDKEDVRRKGF